MRKLLVETLNDSGQQTEIDQEGNVLATREGKDSDGPHLVLNTHLDTVPPHIPYEQDNHIVRGRGACDAKGPLAVFVDVFLTAELRSGQLTLAITPNEETSQIGGAYLGETLTADGFVVGEPTGLDVCIAAKGNFGGEVHVFGESAHASDPSEGINTAKAVGPVVEALSRFDEEKGPGPHELLGEPTIAPTRIETGGPLNQIPEHSVVSFDRRTVPPETITGFLEELELYLQKSLPAEYEYEVRPAYPDSPAPDAFATDSDERLVQLLRKCSGREIRPFEAATEASYFAKEAPTVVFGPGLIADEHGPVAHSNREYINRSELETAAGILRDFVSEYFP